MIASAFFGPQTAAMVAANLVVFLKNGIDPRPGVFNRILAGEERSVAGYGVAQQQLVRRFLVRVLFEQIELPLIADELIFRA
jgi:hypothetical protein